MEELKTQQLECSTVRIELYTGPKWDMGAPRAGAPSNRYSLTFFSVYDNNKIFFTSHWNNKCWDVRLCESKLSSVCSIKSEHRSRIFSWIRRGKQVTSALPDIQPNCIQMVSGKIAIFQTDFCRLLSGKFGSTCVTPVSCLKFLLPTPVPHSRRLVGMPAYCVKGKNHGLFNAVSQFLSAINNEARQKLE
jgi:hypothetical protein